MKKAFVGIGIFLLLLSIVSGIYLFFKKESKEDISKVIRNIEYQYINPNSKLIQAFPNQPDSEYLSESIGLYMNYLVKNQQKDTFDKLFKNFKNEFIIKRGNQSYIKWLLGDEINTNALIDDIRIITALNQASSSFNNEEYMELSKQIINTISNMQRKDGYYVDFYDWSLGKSASRITLSYLTVDFFTTLPNTDKTKQLLTKTNEDNIFFPEYYDLEKKNYVSQDEVHMVDQLLIAINRNNIGFESKQFTNWLIKEWKKEKKLFGRYQRGTLVPSVQYESLSVYYYLYLYFEKIGEEKLADNVKKQAQKIVTNSINNQTHFFDYMHYQQMLLE